jgi:hypothetical protein
MRYAAKWCVSPLGCGCLSQCSSFLSPGGPQPSPSARGHAAAQSRGAADCLPRQLCPVQPSCGLCNLLGPQVGENTLDVHKLHNAHELLLRCQEGDAREAGQRQGRGRQEAKPPQRPDQQARTAASSSSLRLRLMRTRTRRGTWRRRGRQDGGSERQEPCRRGMRPGTGFGEPAGQDARCGCPSPTAACSAQRPRGPPWSSWPSRQTP